MKEMVDTFKTNASGYVNQEYLENDVEDGFDKVEKQAVELTDDANGIIEGVQDLVSVKRIDESEVVEDVQLGKEKAQEIVEELNILDEYEASQLEKTKDDLQTMRRFLSDIESKFKSGDLSVRNYNVEALQDLTAYNEIMDSIYNKDQETISAMYGENIDEMPLYEIEKMHEGELENLQSGGEYVLNMAFEDLEIGKNILTFLTDSKNLKKILIMVKLI